MQIIMYQVTHMHFKVVADSSISFLMNQNIMLGSINELLQIIGYPTSVQPRAVHFKSEFKILKWILIYFQGGSRFLELEYSDARFVLAERFLCLCQITIIKVY